MPASNIEKLDGQGLLLPENHFGNFLANVLPLDHVVAYSPQQDQAGGRIIAVDIIEEGGRLPLSTSFGAQSLSAAGAERVSGDERLDARTEDLWRTYQQVLAQIDFENSQPDTPISSGPEARVYPIDKLGVLQVPKSESVIRHTQAERLRGLVEQMAVTGVNRYVCTVPSFQRRNTYYPLLGLSGVGSYHTPKFDMVATNDPTHEATFVGLIPVNEGRNLQDLNAAVVYSSKPMHVSVPLYEPGLMEELEIEQHIADNPAYTGLYMLITPLTKVKNGVSRARMFGQLPSGDIVEEPLTHYPALTLIGRVNSIIEKHLSPQASPHPSVT